MYSLLKKVRGRLLPCLAITYSLQHNHFHENAMHMINNIYGYTLLAVFGA